MRFGSSLMHCFIYLFNMGNISRFQLVIMDYFIVMELKRLPYKVFHVKEIKIMQLFIHKEDYWKEYFVA